MDRDEVIDRLRSTEGDLRRLGVRTLRLFGSVARDKATPESDVDLLGARVDLVTESGLREGVRSHVEREAIRVA